MDTGSQNFVNFADVSGDIFFKNIEECNFFVTLFLYIIWLSAMKYIMVRGICVQQVTYFGELWSTFVGAEILSSEYLL